MSKKFSKIGILYGGMSSEREVSLTSGENVFAALEKKKYDCELIDFSVDKIPYLLNANFDAIFNALHGEYGEDGRVQSILEFAKIPYTHSGVFASSLCMNKIMTKNFVNNIFVDVNNTKEKINTPKAKLLSKNEIKNNLEEIISYLNLPFVIKPNIGGSSVEVFIINNKEEFYDIFTMLDDKQYLVEEFIKGVELTCSVFENKPMAVTEIRTKNKFYDYKAKYEPLGSVHILPAEISIQKENEIMAFSAEIHKNLGLKGLSRSDFILANDKCYFLEVNTQPGMTKTSLSPEQALFNGISYEDFVEKIINDASINR